MIAHLAAAAEIAYVPLPYPETLRLLRLARKSGALGDNALETLIRANIHLILKTANHYRHLSTPTCTEDDLQQAALIGFLLAVRGFKPNNGNRFSTYAVTSMRNTIQRTLSNESSGLRISINRQRQRAQIHRAQAAHTARTGHPPKPAQLTRATGLSSTSITAALNVPTIAFSLDDEDNDDDSPLGEFLRDPNQLDPAAAPNRQALLRFLGDRLGPSLCDILTLHCGLHPLITQSLTLDEISEYLLRTRRKRISRQRVHQLILSARRILNTPPNAAALRQLLTDQS